MVRVFSKRTFEFTRREEKDGLMAAVEVARTGTLDFFDLPDWAVSDPLFKWAQQDGDIEVIFNKADEKEAELNATIQPAQAVNTANATQQNKNNNGANYNKNTSYGKK